MRGARTFKPRRRGLGSVRQRIFDALKPVWSFDEEGDVLEPFAYFEECNRVCVEIGSGNGSLASSFARSHRTTGLISVDVHRPGIARLLDDIGEFELGNLRVVEGDALVFLERLPTASIDELWVFFPDPWPKNSQAHRRLISADRLPALARPIRLGGFLRLATDVDSYAEQMRRLVEGSDLFDEVVAERPEWRIETAFEARGRMAGRSATDLRCRRRH